MGKRGPQTEDSKLYVLNQAPKVRPKPMPGMTVLAKKVWRRIVAAYPAEHFKPQHYDLLKVYCESTAIHDEMIKAIKKTGFIPCAVKAWYTPRQRDTCPNPYALPPSHKNKTFIF